MKREVIEMLWRIDVNLIQDMESELAGQLELPEERRNEALIAELRDSIEETRGEMVELSRKRSLDNVMRMLEEYEEPRRPKLKRWLAAAAACAAVFVLLNATAMKGIGMNRLSADHTLCEGGLIVSTDETRNEPVIEIPPENYCGHEKLYAEYGVNFPAPVYLPEGAEFSQKTVYDNEIRTIWLYYKRGSANIMFGSTSYRDSDEVPELFIHTDSYDVREKKIGGKTVYIQKDGTTFNAYFLNGNVICQLCTEKLDLKESEKILESMIYQR